MNTPKKKTCFYSKPPPMTLHLDCGREQFSRTNRDRYYSFKSHYKKYQLKFFLTCSILHETLFKKEEEMKSTDFPTPPASGMWLY